jgi:phenylacetate-CoA ligase
VRETYGNSEAVSAGAECAAGKLHLWPELGAVEVMDGDQPAADGTAGDLVFTAVSNPAMPLIRYRIGDRGRLSMATTCSCGRTLPILESIDGRKDDVLFTTDGRQIGRLDPVFKANLPIAEAQIIQETLSRVRVRYVPGEGWNDSAGKTIIERLRERMGPVEVVLEPVPEVPRGRGGKFQAVICRVPPEERQRMRLGMQSEISK